MTRVDAKATSTDSPTASASSDNSTMTHMPDSRYFDAQGNYLDGPHYGKDCPVGKVQLEFVTTDGRQFSPYGWTPGDQVLLDVYIDGRRFHITVGTFHDGRAERRGLHIITGLGVKAETTAMNAASVWFESAPSAAVVDPVGDAPAAASDPARQGICQTCGQPCVYQGTHP